MSKAVFRFKHFDVNQENSALKVGADAMLLGALIETSEAQRAIDIGAGTGVLSLMLAQKSRLTKIDAVEIDEKSFLDCQSNFNNSPWSERLRAIHTDIISYRPSEKYDLVISNPPFYSDSLINTDERIARTKHSAFLPLQNLVSWVAKNMSDIGSCWMIWPHVTFNELLAEVERNQMNLHREVLIQSKPERPSRMVIQFGKQKFKIIKTTLTLRDEQNNYTDQYIQLTREFHAVDLSIKNGKS